MCKIFLAYIKSMQVNNLHLADTIVKIREEGELWRANP
jgi:hypothetical protein